MKYSRFDKTETIRHLEQKVKLCTNILPIHLKQLQNIYHVREAFNIICYHIHQTFVSHELPFLQKYVKLFSKNTMLSLEVKYLLINDYNLHIIVCNIFILNH